MESNNPIIPAAPTPSTSSMPEFAAAPAAPAPVVPPATSMPEFGAAQPVQPAQPEQPIQPVEPVAPVAETPVMPMPETLAPEEQPTPEPMMDEVITSTLGEISNEEPTEAPVEAPAETPAEAAPVITDMPSSVESNVIEPETQPEEVPTVSPNPVENLTPVKKTNLKLIAIIGGAVAVLVIIASAVIILLNQPKGTQNPENVPVSSFDELPDNSTPYAELNKDTAIAFLTSVGKTTKYFPVGFLNEEDEDIFAIGEEKDSRLLPSYETVEQVTEIAIANKIASGIEVTTKDDYAIAVASEGTDCSQACYRGVSFNNKVMNYYVSAPYFDPVTNTTVAGAPMFFFTNLDEAKVKRYLPVVAYLTATNIVYSTDFTATDAAYTFTMHTLTVGVDAAAAPAAEAGEVPYAITKIDVTYTVDRATGAIIVLNNADTAPKISITSEEAAALI